MTDTATRPLTADLARAALERGEPGIEVKDKAGRVLFVIMPDENGAFDHVSRLNLTGEALVTADKLAGLASLARSLAYDVSQVPFRILRDEPFGRSMYESWARLDVWLRSS